MLTGNALGGKGVEVVIAEVAGTSGDDEVITKPSYGHARAGANGLYPPNTSGSTLARRLVKTTAQQRPSCGSGAQKWVLSVQCVCVWVEYDSCVAPRALIGRW